MSAVHQVFHVAVAAYYVVVSHWIKENMIKHAEVPNPDPVIKSMQRYSLRYLTNWTFTLQSIYFFIAFGEELLALAKGGDKIKGQLNKLKNYFFTVLVAPMALVVTITFWSFWLVDRELIFPRVMDEVLPSWVNHSLHTTTSVLVLMEMYLCFHKYPAFKRALFGITVFLAVYTLCLIGTYLQSGVWLYPVFKMLSWTLRICFCLGVYVLAIAIYGAGYMFNKVLWGENGGVTKKAPRKKHNKH